MGRRRKRQKSARIGTRIEECKEEEEEEWKWRRLGGEGVGGREKKRERMGEREECENWEEKGEREERGEGGGGEIVIQQRVNVQQTGQQVPLR